MTRTPSWRTDKRTAAQRGYGHKWRVARLKYLQANPLCVYCEEDGRVTLATVVNHVMPHQGDQELFWDTDNWAAICATHHDSTIAREEYSGVKIGGDELGQPIDPNHWWHR